MAVLNVGNCLEYPLPFPAIIDVVNNSECSLKRYQAKLEIYPTRQTIHSTYLQQAV